MLFGVGVGVLDDLGEGPGGVSYDAAVSVGVGHARRQYRDGVSLALVGGDQFRECPTAQEGGVSTGQDDGSGEFHALGGKVLECHAYCVPGAVLLFLNGDPGFG